MKTRPHVFVAVSLLLLCSPLTLAQESPSEQGILLEQVPPIEPLTAAPFSSSPKAVPAIESTPPTEQAPVVDQIPTAVEAKPMEIPAIEQVSFEAVVSEGWLRYDTLPSQEQDIYKNWAIQFARHLAKKEPNFLRTCSQEATPNPTCALVSQRRGSESEKATLSKAVRKSFYDAVAALDNPATRGEKCKTSLPKLKSVIATAQASRIHPRALYWALVCTEIEIAAKRISAEKAKTDLAGVTALAEKESAAALAQLEGAHQKEIATVAKEYEVMNKLASIAKPAKIDVAKARALKTKLDRLTKKKLVPKLPRDIADKLRGAKRLASQEGKALQTLETFATKTKNDLWNRFPFSLHTFLALEKDPNSPLFQAVQNQPDLTAVAESSDLRLNNLVLMVEALIRNKKIVAAEFVARAIAKDISKIEDLRFRLYFSGVLVVLAREIPSVLLLSQNLGPLLRDHEQLIGLTTLRTLFPLEYRIYDARRGDGIDKQGRDRRKTVGEILENDRLRNGMDKSLLAGLLYVESAFNPNAASHAGANGLTQMLLSTANERLHTMMADEPGYDVEQMKGQSLISEAQLKYDLTLSIGLGTEYFEAVRRDFRGSEGLALAAYNSGPTFVNNWLAGHNFMTEQIRTDLIAMDYDGDFHASDYALSILAKAKWYKLLYYEGQR